MLPIFLSTNIKAWDQYTIENEPIESIELMERASKVIFDWLTLRLNPDSKIYIICGSGNNGGDGLCVARLLYQEAYLVNVYCLNLSGNISPEFQNSYDRLVAGGFNHFLTESEFLEGIQNSSGIILDALLGSGINRAIGPELYFLTQEINQSKNIKISIDLPSGMFAMPPWDGICIEADFTLSLQSPKLTALLPDTGPFYGHLEVLEIGLSQGFVKNISTAFHWLERRDILDRLKERQPFDYKNKFGHVLVIGGANGMTGATLFAARSALRGGCGLCSILSLEENRSVFQTALPEAMFLTPDVGLVKTYKCIAIGPGMGAEQTLIDILHEVLSQSETNLVIDADGLNAITSEEQLGLNFNNKILTPHIGEFDRLFGGSANHYERLSKARSKAIQFNCFIVLKGHFTAIVNPSGNVLFNSTGNSSLAKGGSGDVLCGLISAFVAQSYELEDACILGVYLHGLAADLYVMENGMESLLATDLIEMLPKAFKLLWDEKKAGSSVWSWNQC